MSPFSPIYDYFVTASQSALPQDVLNAAKRAIIDTVAVMIAGTQIEPLPSITKIPSAAGGDSTITCIGSGFPATTAAFYNATAAHVLDMDDYGLCMGHPSAVLVPALFALGEELNVSGQKLLNAYATSIAAGYALGKQCYYKIHARGWHATSVFMSVVASWGCGFLQNFNKEKYQMCTTCATSFSCGIRGNFGTPVKPIHAGLAAQNAVLSSQLVNSGVSGSNSSVFGKEGFLRLYADMEWGEKDSHNLSCQLQNTHPLIEPGLTIKMFPSCSSNHQATFAFLDILKEHPNITPDDIASIEVSLTQKALSELVSPNPTTGVEARFSPAFHFALALHGFNISPQNFTTEIVQRPEIQNIINLTSLVHDPSFDNIPGILPWPARVTVVTKSGEILSKIRIYVDGGSTLPLTSQQLKEKFFSCVAPILGDTLCNTLYEKLLSLESLDSIFEVTRLLRGAEK